MNLAYKFIDSPLGQLKLVASREGLVAILWENDSPQRVRLGSLVENASDPILLRTQAELAEYFAGQRESFTIPLDMRGTAFQKQVWEALLAIPFGSIRTYSQLAVQVRNSRATRAVEVANGRNPAQSSFRAIA